MNSRSVMHSNQRRRGAGPGSSASCRGLLLLAALVAAFGSHAQSLDPTVTLQPADYTHFESPQTQPIRRSPDGTRLFAVNTAASRLSVFSLAEPLLPRLIAEIPVGIEPVSVWPVSNDEAWVVNHVSDSVSVVSVSRGIVTATLAAGDEPSDIVVAGNPARAYVSASRSNELRVFDLATRTLQATIPLLGEHPRALAVSDDGSRVYVAFALSGNGTTIWPRAAPQRPPVQPAPSNPLLPAPPRTSLIFDESHPDYGSVIGYTVLDHDVAEIDTASDMVVRYFDAVGTINLGIAVEPGSERLFVANTEARNQFRFLENLRGHVVDNRVTRIDTGINPQVSVFDLNPGIDYTLLPNPAALTTALAQPTALLFDPAGEFMWLAAFGTDRIAKVDTNGEVLARIEVGNTPGTLTDPENKRGPRGLALAADGSGLYVQNRISNTISVIDTGTLAVIAEVAVGSSDPTPDNVRRGRGYLYDAKLSGNGTASCAACHVDGATDNLAWDLGDRAGDMVTVFDPISGTPYPLHPMKGPLVTQTLAGLKGFAPYHWRGDLPDLFSFNDNFDFLLGGAQLDADDMQQLIEFMESIMHMPNPLLNLDRSLPYDVDGGDANVGLLLFQATPSPTGGAACSSCHSLPTLPFRAEVVPAEDASAAFARKVPTLRQLYKKAGFDNSPGALSTMGFGQICDGSVSGTGESGPGFNPRSFTAFQRAWDSGTAPAVGRARTVTAANAGDTDLEADWRILEQRVDAGDNDLIVHGEIEGTRRGLLYQRASGLYSDSATGMEFTRSQLLSAAQSGATFTVLGVAPGNGPRMSSELGDGNPIFANGFEQLQR